MATYILETGTKGLLFCRYTVVLKSGAEIHRILEENCVTFRAENNRDLEAWMNYKKFVDDIVSEAMLSAVGCRYEDRHEYKINNSTFHTKVLTNKLQFDLYCREYGPIEWIFTIIRSQVRIK